jgi:outer membrane protein OmpA-like peptidoglycan-associated protein
MAELRIRRKDLDKPEGLALTLPCLGAHTIVVCRQRAEFIEFADTLFRNNSGVLLPTALAPAADGTLHPGLDTVAACLRYAQHNPGKKVLVAGHTDTVGSDEANVRLSQIRGQTVHGIIAGQRESFAESSWGPHLTGEQRYPSSNDKRGVLWDDYIDVLQWVEDVFGWPCSYPRNKTLWKATCVFQESYNANAHAGNPDPGTSDLQVTGKFDKPTWAAVYDCYDSHLGTILEVDRDGLADLRGQLSWLDDANHFVGCGERKPIDQAGRDNYKSQTNRRVENFFFDPGEEPELPCLQGACVPAQCLLHDPNWFVLLPLPVDPNAIPTTAPLIGARLPSRSTPGRTFPKPSMLPMLCAVAARMTLDPSLKAMVMGFTDRTGSDAVNLEVSRNRAAAVVAWLCGNADFFRSRFDTADPVARWGWEEIQWMLSAIHVADDPCYAGMVDAHVSTMTRSALRLFQLSRGLESHGQADDATLAALIRAYLELVVPAGLAKTRFRVVAGGSWHPPRSLGPGSDEPTLDLGDRDPEFRRVEVFLTAGEFKPPPEACAESRHADCVAYRSWCLSAAEEIALPPLLPISVRVVDDEGLPLEGRGLGLFEHSDAGEASKGTVATDQLGIARFDAAPGMYSLALNEDGEELRVSFLVNRDDPGSATIRFPVNVRGNT